MSEMIQTVAKEMLNLNKQVADWQIEQAKVVEKQVADAFVTGRQALEMQRDLAQNMGKVILDAAAPKAAPKA